MIIPLAAASSQFLAKLLGHTGLAPLLNLSLAVHFKNVRFRVPML